MIFKSVSGVLCCNKEIWGFGPGGDRPLRLSCAGGPLGGVENNEDHLPSILARTILHSHNTIARGGTVKVFLS